MPRILANRKVQGPSAGCGAGFRRPQTYDDGPEFCASGRLGRNPRGHDRESRQDQRELKAKGKQLAEVTPQEFDDIAHDVGLRATSRSRTDSNHAGTVFPYVFLLVLGIAAVSFAVTPLLLAWLWARKFSPAKPGEVKSATYECGLESRATRGCSSSLVYLYAIISHL
jgi:hypothetical protein